MSYPINYPTPQGANIQIINATFRFVDWVKPQGASFVWFTLIGPGGTGNGTNGGGSGAVTNFMGPAFLIPDVLRVRAGSGLNVQDTEVQYQVKDGVGYKLLEAKAAAGATGGTASASNYFSCMGFYQSVAGQNGFAGEITASSSTFFSGGGAGSSNATANYGYSYLGGNNIPGFFQTQPIIVGIGSTQTTNGAIGCGGGVDFGTGGNGLVVIITW
jgi:hypothetical protein